MNICIISFSGRADGNCHDITSVVSQALLNEHHVAAFELCGSEVSPCGNCGYSCFSDNQACPMSSDDVAKIYDCVCSSELAYYIVPNYCDYPGSLFFILNERGQSFFSNDPNRLELYLKIEKRFIVVTNTEQENFKKAFKYHVRENGEPDILFLAAKDYGVSSIEGGLMNSEQARRTVIDYATGPGSLSKAGGDQHPSADVDDEQVVYETAPQMIDISYIRFRGRVLDIGGGGEGIISRHSGEKVISIDIRKEELEEAPDRGLKIIMDARRLGFLDLTFENVTCFFSLMYMDESEIGELLKEAYRVLKAGGELWVWDIAIPPKTDADIFIAQVNVRVSGGSEISAGYGVRRTRAQSADTIRGLCENAGFVLRAEHHFDQAFMLRMVKC